MDASKAAADPSAAGSQATPAQPCLGIDVGGTFTDLALCIDGEALLCLKVASTPERPGLSSLQGVDELRRLAGLAEEDWRALSHTHSNTVALNCLLERSGAQLGLLVTSGFRDLLEIARLTVPEPARYDSRRAKPLIPRQLVAEVEERLDAEGEVVKALSESSTLAAAAKLRRLGCQALVICFLHSYRNPAHERRAHDLIKERFPELGVDLSCEVWPQAREFERAALAVINAYIRPAVERQVELLTQGMAERGLRSPARGARSNGGMERLTTLAERPVTALLSGPAAGVAGAAAAASAAGWNAADLMTLDIGGTSADLGVVRRGQPVLSTEEKVAGFPILVPTVAVSAIGAGGGSIIWTDPAGTLKVGPKSAGAVPGPACYGTAGNGVPAMTDAFLLAGLLNPDRPLAGRLKLHEAPARRALAEVGQRTGLSAEQVADGAIQITTAMLAAESTSLLARRDLDLAQLRMVAYGGAGPLLAALVAEAVYLDAVLIPPAPGALSAWGAAGANLQGDFVQPVYQDLGRLDAEALRGLFAALSEQAAAWLKRESADLQISHATLEYGAEMRYEGQGYDVPTPLQEAWLKEGEVEALGAAFHDAHARMFGHRNEGAPVWLQELRAHLTGYPPKPKPALAAAAQDEAPIATRRIRLRGELVEAQVMHRAALADGRPVVGPAIIEQMDTTTLVPDGWTLSLADAGALVLSRSAHS